MARVNRQGDDLNKTSQECINASQPTPSNLA